MRVGSKSSLGLVGVVLALVGCTTKPCDEAKLAQVADALDDRSVAGRDAALDALADACPQLPKGLALSLAGWFGSESVAALREQSGRSRFEDRDYVEVRSRTCPVSGPAWDETITAHDRDAAVFEACGLQRYDLLAEGEAFVFEDLDAFVLYEWLTGRGIDEALSRRIARALLSTHQSAAELMDECRRKGERCGLALERRGISLPRPSKEVLPIASFGGRTQLWVTRDAVLVGDEQVLELATTARGSPQIRAALAGADPRVLILADASLAFGTVADRWLDAVAAGGADFELALFDADGLRAMAVAPARAWFVPAARERELEKPPPQPELWISSDALELRYEGRTSYSLTRACLDARCLDLAALTRALRGHERANSKRSIVVRVARDVPYETVVALLLLVRGRDEWDPIIDTNPPLHWHVDSTLTLGDAKVERKPGRDRSGRSTDELLAAYEAKREQLRACLLADPPFLAAAGEAQNLTLLWVPEHDGALVSTGTDDDSWASPELQACICRELDIESAAPRNRTMFVLDFGVQLTIPVRFEPNPTE